MGCRVIGLDTALMDLFSLGWRLRQGALVVKQAPLDVTVRLHQVLRAFALRADNRLMLHRSTFTDRVKRVGGEGPATLREQGLGGPIAPTRRIEHSQRGPRRFGGGHGPGQDGP